MFSGSKKFFFENFVTLFYASSQCGRYNLKKILKKFFFAHEKLKKLPKKVAHNSQPAVFFITCLAAQKAHFGQK